MTLHDGDADDSNVELDGIIPISLVSHSDDFKDDN